MAFTPTHSVPRTVGGIATWPAPDPATAEGPRLDPGLAVAVVIAQPDGWTQIECENGWRAWVDGRLLQPVGAPAARARGTQARAQTPTQPQYTQPQYTQPAPPPPTGFATAPVATAPASTAPLATGPLQIRGVSITTPLIAGALVVAGALLPWISAQGASKNALGIPLKVLFDPKSAAAGGGGGLKIGFVLLPLGALIVAAGFTNVPRPVARGAGGAAMLLATLFLGQLQRVMGQAQAGTVFGVLGFGVYMTTVGGVVAAMSKGPAPGSERPSERAGASERPSERAGASERPSERPGGQQ